MRKTLVVTVLALAALSACTSSTAPAAHECVNGTWTGSGEKC